ncbi:MAG: DinB family protein [Acidobacteriota bacterium]
MQAETKRMSIIESILMEIEQEAAITKSLLEIVPEDKLSWRPHPKAKSLGEIAMHIAGLQGGVATLGQNDIAERPDDLGVDPEAQSRDEILKTFAESQEQAKAIVGSTSEDALFSEWKLVSGGKTLAAMPRIAFWRSILLNHNYHHRGQLATYLRQLDVPLPSVYGPSADANPFA